MALDYATLSQLKKTHPAWRLMVADHGPLVIAFLDRVFREENHRTLAESDLVLRLEDFLYHLHAEVGEDFPRETRRYLDDWASDEKGWLRKFYPPGSDEAHFDLTPASEKTMHWLEGLLDRGFVGTEGRLYTAVNLLREIVHGVEEDQDTRIARLEQQKSELDRKIREIQEGKIPTLDDRELKERFAQFSRTARELLTDFRAVEQNFRDLDRRVREQIAGWTGEKGSLLANVFGEHDTITDSDEGRSFRAFWDFLMSPSSQEELTELLDRVYELDALGQNLEDRRLRRIHYDWMSAGEQTQRTVARLSQQLRRFLDDKTYFENKRIIHLLDSVEKRALELREDMPPGIFMEVDDWHAQVRMPMERPLFLPRMPVRLESDIDEETVPDIDTELLYNQFAVDKQLLLDHIRTMLSRESQVSLEEVVAARPLTEGLAELIAYLSLAADNPYGHIDDENRGRIQWRDREGIARRAHLPRIIFQKSARGKENPDE